jgi:hypothetical protein
MLRGLLLALIACTCLGACGGDSGGGPTGPSTPNYAGEWRGTTFQDQPFSFLVSPNQRVTAITIGYRFSGCSGVDTFSDLDLPITPAPPYAAYGKSDPDGRGTSIQIFFRSERDGFATVVFYGPASCGSTGESGPPVQVTRR